MSGSRWKPADDGSGDWEFVSEEGQVLSRRHPDQLFTSLTPKDISANIPAAYQERNSMGDIHIDYVENLNIFGGDDFEDCDEDCDCELPESGVDVSVPEDAAPVKDVNPAKNWNETAFTEAQVDLILQRIKMLHVQFFEELDWHDAQGHAIPRPVVSAIKNTHNVVVQALTDLLVENSHITREKLEPMWGTWKDAADAAQGKYSEATKGDDEPGTSAIPKAFFE